MTKDERLARQNPVCREYRRISLLLSYALRGKLTNGFVYHRDANNPYSITLSKGKLVYKIWYFKGARVVTTLERRTRPSRGITTDPDLKILIGAAETDTVVEEITTVLRKHGVIR